MDDTNDLRQEVEDLKRRVAYLEQQLKAVAESVINIDADGVDRSVLAGVVEGNVNINQYQFEPKLKPKEWEFLRLLVEADETGKVEDSIVHIFRTQQGEFVAPYSIKDEDLRKRLQDIGLPLKAIFEGLVAEGLIQWVSAKSYKITARAHEAIRERFPNTNTD